MNNAQNAAVRDDDIRLSTNTQLIGTGRYDSGLILRAAGRLQYFQHARPDGSGQFGCVGVYADAGKRFGATFARLGYFGNYRRRNGADQFIE